MSTLHRWHLPPESVRSAARACREVARSRAPAWALSYHGGDFPRWAMTVDAVGLAVDEATSRLEALVIERAREPFAGSEAWPGGFVEQRSDVNARAAMLRELEEETGRGTIRHLETLDTYDDTGRDPRQFAGVLVDGKWMDRGARVVSKAFLAVLHRDERELAPNPHEDAAAARWVDVYEYLPWEDVRTAAGWRLARAIGRALRGWAAHDATNSALERRVTRAFASSAAAWNEERASERFALLTEAGLVAEAWRDQWGQPRGDMPVASLVPGRTMAFDHRRMLADALGRVRGKLKYAPGLLAALAGRVVTLPEVQRVCEAVSGRPLRTTNLRRVLTETHGILRPAAGRRAVRTGPGPKPLLYQFASGVESERMDVAIRFPWAPLPSGSQS